MRPTLAAAIAITAICVIMFVQQKPAGEYRQAIERLKAASKENQAILIVERTRADARRNTRAVILSDKRDLESLLGDLKPNYSYRLDEDLAWGGPTYMVIPLGQKRTDVFGVMTDYVSYGDETYSVGPRFAVALGELVNKWSRE